MSTRARRLPALLAICALLLGSMPVAASDPEPSADAAAAAAPSPEAPTSPRTIHAEMLAAPPEGPARFVEGVTPEPLPAPRATVQGTEAQGATSSLPNGLTHEVYGYLPYWALDPGLRQYLQYDLVSTIAYFSVGAQADGTLLRSGVGWNGWASSNMTDVINQAHANGVGVHLTVTMMAWSGDYSAMTALLTSAPNRARLAGEIAATVAARNADGVNLDFEPVPNSLESHYVTFVREVKAALVAAGAGSYLTVAATGGAAAWDEGYDLVGLSAAGAADAIMVMAYDFSWPGSARAGGVSPIYSPYIFDVTDAVATYLARVPADKLIWGVPYYGRAWTTQTSTVNSLTCKSASICPTGNAGAGAFGRSWAPRYVDALAAVGTHGRRWDSNGQVPWYTYFSSTYNTHVQGYYDDAESLHAKYALVTGNGMRGVGIWHLLMDVERPELWDKLAGSFAGLPFGDMWSSPFRDDIMWLFETGITTGCSTSSFCPHMAVTRQQMASFLSRALALPAATRDYFTDDAGSIHEADINRVAQAGITLGCGPTSYCPHLAVTRQQMASFLSRALALPSATQDYFTDDAGSMHEADINRVAQAGITLGCGGGQYCPLGPVTREQMAAFLHRALGS
ncbi:MAG: glycosyl hydrolase family 18 protein [Candidatus Limnocylindria bacterium]